MMLHDVFISYHNDAREEALALRKALEDNKIAVWMAPDDIKEGFDYSSSVPNAIENCKVFVPILSPECNETVWMPKEVDTAVNTEKIILPYLLEGPNAPESLIFYLAGIEKFKDIDTLVARIKKEVSNNGHIFFTRWSDTGPYKKLNDKEEYLSANIMVICCLVFGLLSFFIFQSMYVSLVYSIIATLIYTDLVWYTSTRFIRLITRTDNVRLIVFSSILLTIFLAVFLFFALLLLIVLVLNKFF